MDILSDIKEITEKMDAMDKYAENLPGLQSDVDSKISDLLHHIEHNNLKAFDAYRIVKEIHNQRVIRRKIKNDFELVKAFKMNSSKLCNEANRKMLLSEIYRLNNRLNLPYKNRVYSQEELNSIVYGKKNN